MGTMHGSSCTYICARCGLPSRVQAYEFFSLPTLPMLEFTGPGPSS